MRLRRTAALVSAAVVAVTVMGATAVSATPPVTLGSGYVLDDAGVLSSSEEAQAHERLHKI